MTLGVARTPGVLHVASYSCEFDLDGDENDLHDHGVSFYFDCGRGSSFLAAPGYKFSVCLHRERSVSLTF